MTGLDLSVLNPNFTDSPVLIGSDDVKIITPCGFFSPIHPFSVLNDLKLTFSPNQILNVLTSSTASFVNEIIVVLSNSTLLTLISSAYPFDGIKIKDTENNTTIVSKIPLVEDLIM
jgi:hypothetical protein